MLSRLTAFAAAALVLHTFALAQGTPWRQGYGPATAPNAAPARFEYWPGAQYDPAIPTLKSVVGHANGERITRPEDAIRYLAALRRAAPARMRLYEYAKSWEGRPLVYAIIGSSAAIARLDEIRGDIARVSDPGAALGDALSKLPATVFLSYGVHGNEISSTDAALMTAYHLLAAKGDASVDKILLDALVFIDPMQNPDGRARFVHNFETTQGLENSGSAIAAERNEPWPGGRTNHYLFDMNRDWFAMTQPETRGRIRLLREWRPLVFVDLHEMGTESTYYFSPEARPYNPHLAGTQRESLELFGRNNAKWFDRNGFPYFTREVYDAFYPGYGASWPSYYGAIAMTYERASARGLLAERRNGPAFHYRDSVQQHFLASIATAETAAVNHDKLWRDFRAFQESAVNEGRREDIGAYILPAGHDDAAAFRLAGLLTAQGVAVLTAKSAFSACGQNFPAGSHVVPMAQAAKRLVRTLLDQQVDLEADFLAEQERRRAKDLGDEIYDVTAWSLPLMMGVAIEPCAGGAPGGGNFVRHGGRLNRQGALAGPDAAVAYLVPWGERPATRLLARALRAGLTVSSSDRAFTASGRRYPAGSLIFQSANNRVDLRATLVRLARETGAGVTAVGDSWVSDGPNFGSENVVSMRAPKIAIAWDEPASPTIAGATRFVIERQFDYPAIPVRVEDLNNRALDGFDVLVLPGGGDYATALGQPGVERLKSWVDRGGVLIATGSATRFLADPKTDLLSIRREDAAREGGKDDAKADDEKATVDGVILTNADAAKKSIAPEKEGPDATAGVLLTAEVDPDHWLAAGVKPFVTALFSGSDIYTPATLDEGVNVARYTGAETVVASGYLWAETKAQLAYKPFVVAEPQGDG
ncbi:MAG: M14 family zinc carboxypeptidase, partial [Parvularculaceae bacterium]